LSNTAGNYVQSSITIPSDDGELNKRKKRKKKRKRRMVIANQLRTIPGHTVKST
jgi:hypothetical protein